MKKKLPQLCTWMEKNLFALSVLFVLFIAFSTFKQQKLSQSALETDTFMFQVS